MTYNDWYAIKTNQTSLELQITFDTVREVLEYIVCIPRRGGNPRKKRSILGMV